VQGETSKNSAGFPTIVTPATFGFDNATRHLELLNVKHFIAKWTETKKALSSSKNWKLLSEADGWQLYELLTHNGRHVCIPGRMPIAVRLDTSKDNWKRAGMEWIYTIQLIDQPFVFLQKGEPDDAHLTNSISEDEFLRYTRAIREDKTQLLPSSAVSSDNAKISDEQVTDDTIKFRTTGIGLPHLVKCAYFPNWKVKGAKKVFMVTPCFMLVYPEQEQVEIYYGYTFSDNTGRLLSVIGAILLVATFLKNRREAMSQPAKKLMPLFVRAV
jgi:hypothetical protein